MIRFHKTNAKKQYFIEKFANRKVNIFGFDEMLAILEAFPSMSSREIRNYVMFGMLKSNKYQNVEIAKDYLEGLSQKDKKFVQSLMK